MKTRFSELRLERIEGDGLGSSGQDMISPEGPRSREDVGFA